MPDDNSIIGRPDFVPLRRLLLMALSAGETVERERLIELALFLFTRDDDPADPEPLPL